MFVKVSAKNFDSVGYLEVLASSSASLSANFRMCAVGFIGLISGKVSRKGRGNVRVESV